MKYIALIILVLAISSFGLISANINVCSNVADGVFLADLNECSGYIVCWEEVAYSSTCENNLNFNAKGQSCEVSNSGCVQQCNDTLSTFAYDKTCTKYVLCFDGTPVVRECLDDLQYNEATDRCDYPQNVDCQANMCSAVNDPDNIVYLASHSSCSKYYICYNGDAVARECTDGLYFNLASKGCDYKANVNCTISAKTRTVLSYNKQPPTRANIPCPKQGSYFYPHENDKTSYYFCLNGNGVTLTCSPGLVYDKNAESCRDPINIGHESKS